MEAAFQKHFTETLSKNFMMSLKKISAVKYFCHGGSTPLILLWAFHKI